MKQKDLSPLGLYAGRDEGQKYPHDDIIKKKTVKLWNSVYNCKTKYFVG